MASKSIKSTPVRFTLTNGENIVLPCTPDMTLGSIKEKIWQKKHYQNDKSQYVFRLLNGEIFFRDTQTISSLFKLEPVFRETRQKPDILEMILLPLVDVGDKRKREAKTPGTANKPLLSGILYKRGRTGTIQSALPWKKRWFVLQDLTLYYFENEETYYNGGAAIDVVAMGSVFAVHAPEFSYKNWPYCFELKAESVGKRDFVLCAESQPEMETWIQLIFAVNFRRIKSITVTICEELSSRGLSKMEGIFRVSGSKDVVANIKQQYNLANYPNLTEVKDDHALSGTLKLAIREMSEPLLTYALYKQFIALHGTDPSKRRAQARAVIKQLPPANAAFLQYLCLFLKHVSTFKETNMMTAKNLSIVFAPNILRPREENVASTMVDNNSVLAAVEYLIDSADQIWNGDDEDFPNGISFEAGEALAGGFVPAATSFTSGAASPLARPQTGPSLAASMNISAPAAWAGTVEKEIPGPPPGSPPNGGEFVAQSNPPPVPSRTFPPSASSVTPFGVKKFGGPPPTPPPGNPIGFLGGGGATGGANKQTLDAVQVIRKKYEESIASFEQKMTTRKLEAKRAFDNVITQVNAGGQDPSLLPTLESLVSEEDQWRQEALININEFAAKLNQLATTLQQARTTITPSSQPAPPQHTPPPPPTATAPPPVSVSSSISSPAPTSSPPNSFRGNPPSSGPPRFPIPSTSPTSSASTSAANSNTPSPAPSPSSNTHSIADNPFKKMQMQMNKTGGGPPPIPSNMLSSPTSSSSSTSEDTPISPFKKFGAGAPPPPPGGAAGAKSPIVPAVSRVASPPPAAAAATNGNGHVKADADDDEEDIVIAKYAYASGQHRQDIDLKAGDEIEVHERGEKGWWQGKCLRTGQVGYFPGNYTVAPKLPYQLK